MSIRKIETNVGGSKWEMNTLPATTGLRCLTQLAAIVGAPIGAAAGGIKQQANEKGDAQMLDLDAGSMGDAVAKMTLRLAEPETVDLIKVLLTDLRKDDKKIEFDSYFAANYGELMALVGWSIRENFESFLAGSSVLGALAEKVKASTLAT